MDKREFLAELRANLTGLPQKDVQERLTFLEEMIDDRMEEGLSEEEAVAQIGPVKSVVSQIVAETPLPRLVTERMKPKRRMKGWEVALLILGAPLWIPLLIAAFALLISLYAVIWSVILSLWAVEAAVAVTALACLAMGALLLIRGQAPQGIAAMGAGLVVAGLSMLLFPVFKLATKGAAILTKKLALGVKNLLRGKEKEA